MKLSRLLPLIVSLACALALAPTAAATPSTSTTTAVAPPADNGLPPEHERALFASTYASLRDRVDARGYAPTSLDGYYGGMYTRDASVNAMALILGGDYPQARGILRYILRYTAASGQPTIPHRVFPIDDSLAPAGQQTGTGATVAELGGGTQFTQPMPAPGLVTAVDAWLSRSTGASGMVTATLGAVTSSGTQVVDTTTVPLGDVPAAGGWVTFRFAPPLFSTPPSGGYTLTLSSTAPRGWLTWKGDSSAGAAFRERTHDFTLSGYDAWDEVDEKYSVLLAWARYVVANPADQAFVRETWPLVRQYANYHLDRPGYLSDALDLIRNPILDDEGYNNVYDLLTNTVTAQALHELAPIAARLGAPNEASKWSAAADRISGGIQRNLVTDVDGKPVYAAWYDGNDPSKLTVGWTFVNLAPVAFSWYGLDPTIMSNTIQAYLAHQSRDWSGTRMLSSMSDYAFTGHNDWVLTKGLAWEWAAAHDREDTARIAQLDAFLRHYYPDVTQPISEGWILDSDGNLRVTDPGNQEHASWFATMMLQTYPGLQGHPGRCYLPRDADPATFVSVTGAPTNSGPLEAGQPAQVTVTVTNGTCRALTGVRPSVKVPDGWQVTRAPGPIQTIAARTSASTTFTVVPALAPGDQPISEAEVGLSAAYRSPQVHDGNTSGTLDLRVSGPIAAPMRTFASTEAYFGQLGSRFEIDANGKDMSQSRDEYGTIYRPGGAGPDTAATVQVLSQGDTGPWAKAGIVFRNRLDTRSPGYVLLAITPGNGFALQWDGNGDGRIDGGRSTIATGTTTYPAWLRLVRHDDTYTASYSLDGTTWHPIGTVTVPGTAAGTQDVGIFASAINAVHPDTISDVLFDHLTIQ